jgi:hypothetical protein
MVGAGDAGFFVRGTEYSTILTGGAIARVRLGKHAEAAIGGQYFFEPKVEGNRFAPYTTPGTTYENFVRGEIVERFLEANPGMEDFFPDPVGRSSKSFKAIGYFGFGDLGPLRWSGLHANYLRRHPDNFVSESFMGRDYDIFITDLTDERFQFNIGNEAQLTVIPNHLDVVWAVLYGRHWNEDNDIKAGDDNRTFYSTVLRVQNYLTPEIHLLAETSLAKEKSKQGNLYRNHVDSVFESTGGLQDPRGLEFGDASTRNTWQGKIGVVLNPMGLGIYTRPSLRLLYGVQHSSQNNAFGNNFVESLDDFNQFPNKERHIHHVVALEAEAWF